MSFQLAELLIHSASVPAPARDALRAASSAAPADREDLLRSAARILHHEADVECADAHELVGLPDDCECG